jgi:chromate reductase, NAD(P)H dehydrogenase (quinone)
MPNSLIISGTNRPNTHSARIAEYVRKKYEEVGASATVLDLKDYPFEDTLDGSYNSEKPRIKAINQQLINADGLVFVIPEYNGSFPGVLKVMLDHTPYPSALVHKPIAYIGEASGAFGSLRSVEQLQLVLNYMNALNYPERVFIQRVSKNWSDEDGPTDPFTAKILDEQISGFVKFVSAF